MKKGILAVIAVVVVVGLLGIGWWLIRDRDEGGTEDVQPVQHSPKLTPEERAEAVRIAVEKNRHWWREASYVQIRQAAVDGDAHCSSDPRMTAMVALTLAGSIALLRLTR